MKTARKLLLLSNIAILFTACSDDSSSAVDASLSDTFLRDGHLRDGQLQPDGSGTPPLLTEITPVPVSSDNPIPRYTFATDQAGLISYGGACDGPTTNAVAGHNPIRLYLLADGTYNNCTIRVTNAAGAQSIPLAISSFSINTTTPAPQNVIQNPSFEAGGSGNANYWWSYCFAGSTSCQFGIDNVVARTGQRSVKISRGVGQWSTSFSVTPGKAYRVSYYIKAASTSTTQPNPNVYTNFYLSNIVGTQTTIVLSGHKRNIQTYNNWIIIRGGDHVAQPGQTKMGLHLKFYSTAPNASVIWFDDVVVQEVEPSYITRTGKLLQQKQDHVLWETHPDRKVFMGDTPPTTADLADGVKINVAKGETEPFQLVIKPTTAWQNVTWSWSNFSGPAIIDKSALAVHRVEYVNVPYAEKTAVYGRSGQNPDPLPIEAQSTLRVKVNNPFWFLVSIPQTTPAGTYQSSLTLKQGSNVIATIPLTLRVWDFAIPDKPSIRIDSLVWMNYVDSFETQGSKLDKADRYYKSVFSHRASSGTSGTNIPVLSIVNNVATTDTNELRAHVKLLKKYGFCENLRVDRVLWPAPKNPNNPHMWADNSTWQGIQIFTNANNNTFTDKFKAAFTSHVQNVMNALKAENCYVHPGIKFFDEPRTAHAPTVNAVVAIAKLLKTIDSNIRLFSSGTPHLALLPHFDRWDMNDELLQYYPEELADARTRGNAWIYSNSIPLIDLPLIRSHLYPWILWKEKLVGAYNWWSVTYWPTNPWDGPPQDANGPLNGSGSLLYPARNASEVGPITSLRWEMMRQGLEDYEYLTLLEHLVQTKGAVAPQKLLTAAQLTLQYVGRINRRLSVRWNDQPYEMSSQRVADFVENMGAIIEKLSAL